MCVVREDWRKGEGIGQGQKAGANRTLEITSS